MQCSTCLKDVAEGTTVRHVNGKDYFFCKDHPPAIGKKCAICGNEIRFGEETSSGDLADGQPVCWGCWQLYYPGTD